MMLWFDCETTGTDEKKGSILEVALIITDNKLIERARYHAVIYQSELTLDLTLNDWCRVNHEASGLLDQVKNSQLATSSVEQALIDLIEKHCPRGSRAILCGNSIHFDRRFIASDMPRLNGLLDEHNHRMLDVSSFKEALDRAFGFKTTKPALQHRAIPDIEDSIQEYRDYLKLFSPKSINS